MWNRSVTRTILCRVKSRASPPPAQGVGERDYGLAPCNPVFPSTFTCPALPGTESDLVDYSGLAAWAVNIVKIKFRPGFQILFRRLLRRSQRFPCWLRVLALLLVVFHSFLLRERFMNLMFIGPCITVILEEWKTNLMSLAILFVVIQQHSRRLLKMDILMSETCWAHKKWKKK